MMADTVRLISDSRDQQGRFVAGPNNRGRPVGARGKNQLLAEMRQLGPQALEKLKQALSEGQKWAVETVLQACLPKDGRMVEFHDATPDDIREALRNGDITTTEAKDAATALSKLSDIEQLDALRDRIQQLEQMIAGSDGTTAR